MAKLRHIAIAAKDPDAMADFYVKAFDFKIVRSNDGPLAYGHHLSDGTIDLAILRFKTDQLGRGMDYTGLHHFGILVEDLDAAIMAWAKLDGAVAEARLFPLAQFMGDVYAGALLTEQAAWEREARGTDRKALVARLYAQRYLEDRGPLRGIDADSDEALERFDELVDGALTMREQT